MIPTFILLLAGLPCLVAGQISLDPNDHPAGLKKEILTFHRDKVDIILPRVKTRVSNYMGIHQTKALESDDATAICGCTPDQMFSLRRCFRSSELPSINFHPARDYAPGSFDLTVTNSTAVSTGWTTNWKIGMEWGIEATASFDVKFLGTGGSASIKTNFKLSGEHGWSNNEQTTTTDIEAKRFLCPTDNICQVQTWTFTAEYPGTYFETPVVNFGCGPGTFKWKYGKTDKYHEITKDSTLALPSLVGKSRKWDKLASKYFSINQGGKPITETPPDNLVEIFDAQFPPNSIDVNYHNTTNGFSSIPVMDGEKQYKLQFGLKYHIGAKKRSESLGKRAPIESEIVVLDSNIPGIKPGDIL